MNGAQALVALLQQMQVPFLSVLCGNGLDPLLIAADEAGLPVIDTRNEQAAAYMADAYARLTGRLGVCAVSSGVAHVNALAGVTNAYYDGAPLLLISGASSSETLGRGGFQDLDQVALASPITKHSELVTEAARVPVALRAAVGAAGGGRPGPVHLTISVDALMGDVPADVSERGGLLAGASTARAAGDPAEMAHALALLANARRPVIVAGSCVFHAQAGKALHDFALQSATPVVTPIWDRGVVDNEWSTYMGVVGAASGEPDLLAQADLILVLGALVDYRVQYLDSPPLRPDVKVVRVQADARHLYQGIMPDVAILGDAATVLDHWSDMWAAGDLAPHSGWLEEAREICTKFYRRWWEDGELEPTGLMNGGDLVSALEMALLQLEPEPVFLIDGGNIGQWAHMRLASRRYPSHWLTCGASGAVGWGVPGAMAARLAYPDRPVVLLSGDGSLGFGLVELESAARQGLPFVCVVADDCAWGIVATGQELRCGRRLAANLGPADYAGVARALGAHGVRAETALALQAAIYDAVDQRLPTLIQVPIACSGPAE